MRAFTKEKLVPLIEKHQRTLTLDDVDAIVELDEIAGRIERQVRAATERDYFSVDGHFFKKITFAREQLINRIAERFPSGRFGVIGCLYALDLDRTAEELQTTPGRLTLLKYAAGLDVRMSKAVKALEEQMGLDGTGEDASQEAPEKEKPLDSWGLCCILSSEVGGSPDEWMDATASKFEAGFKTIEAKREAEAKAWGVKTKTPPAVTPKIIAIKEFSARLRALEESWAA